jgi:hypothetical protein
MENQIGNNNLLKNIALCTKNELTHAYFGLRSRLSANSKELNNVERECTQQINNNSAYVIENYWSREKAFRIRDKLAEYHDVNEPFILGDSKKDELVRIYHVERLIPELKEFRFDPFVLNIAKAYNGFPSYSGALVYQHDTVYGREKSHYHVDTFVRQFKSMMYLDDVDVGNGPFSYIPGSHRKRQLFIKKQLKGNKNNKDNVFDESEISSMLIKERSVCVPAGSLLMMDVGCIHRGAPQTERSRSVLMNYIVPSSKDLYLHKNLPPLQLD